MNRFLITKANRVTMSLLGFSFRKKSEEKNVFTLTTSDGAVEEFDHTDYEKYCQWLE